MNEFDVMKLLLNENAEGNVPIHQKLTLTIKEAAAYSNIGINKIESLLKQPNCTFVLYVGNIGVQGVQTR